MGCTGPSVVHSMTLTGGGGGGGQNNTAPTTKSEKGEGEEKRLEKGGRGQVTRREKEFSRYPNSGGVKSVSRRSNGGGAATPQEPSPYAMSEKKSVKNRQIEGYLRNLFQT